MKKIYILIIFLITSTLLWAQQNPGNTAGGQRSWDPAQSPFKVSGQVNDADSGDPLEYVSAVLLATRDSSIVAGAVTDAQGKFTITARPGRFILQIQYISYHDKFIRDIRLNRENLTADVGVIQLAADVDVLDEVVVQGEKTTMVMSLDKRVFNVGKDLSNMGGTAADLLDNIPSVTVDVEGNISLRGSENVRILVDGKPSGLVGISSNDALRQLQGNMVERVEVVTNPSARYDAEGLAGIINIILKKENREGVNGAFNVALGHPENYEVSFNLNYRKKWVNLFANYGVSYRRNPGGGGADQFFFSEDTTYYTDLDREHERGGWSNSFRFGSDFYLNKKNIITVSALYRLSNEDNESNLIYEDFDENRNPLFITDRIDDERERDSNQEYNLNYSRNFKKKGQKWTIDLQYRDNSETESSNLLEQTFVVQGETTEPDLLQRSSNEEFDKGWFVQSDYVHPFSQKGKIEFGVRNTIRDIGNDYLVEEQDESGIWVPLEGFTNNFNYDEDILAAYAIVGNEINKFSYQLGLRMERTDLRTELEQTNEVNDKNYTDFFPSGHFTYKLKETQSLQASYSRRIRRPRFRSLNPFFTFSDARNIRTGNPDLNPEYTDSYELGVLHNWEKSSFFYSAYYRYATGVITRITTVEDGITYSRPENVGTRDAFGLEVTYSNEFTPWWRFNANANFFRTVTDGESQGEDLSAETTSFTTRIISRMTVRKKVDFQTTLSYRAPQEVPQGRRKSVFVMDLGLSRDIMKGKGTLTFTVRDLFNTRKWRSETITSNFISDSEFQWRSRTAILTFNYRLNQKKRRERNRGGRDFNGDDMEF